MPYLLGARLLTVLGLKPHLSYVSQRTYSIPRRSALQFFYPIKLMLPLQLLTSTRRFCLAILLPVANRNQQKRDLPPRSFPRQDHHHFGDRDGFPRFSMRFGLHSSTNWGRYQSQRGNHNFGGRPTRQPEPKDPIEIKKVELVL